MLSLCLSIMSDSMIMDAIASFLVLPNRLVVPLVPGLHVAQLRSPLPRVKPGYASTDKWRLPHMQYIHIIHLSPKRYLSSWSLLLFLRVWYASTY